MIARPLDGFWFAGLLAWLLLLSLLCIPPSALPPSDVAGLDKWLHALAFFLGGLWFLLGARSLSPPGRLYGLLLMLGVGALIEILQSQSINRSAEWLDWLADGAGLAVAYGLVAVLPPRWRFC